MKSLSGVWNIRHDSSCMLGGPSEKALKAHTEMMNCSLQAATRSRVARTGVCCKPHVGIRVNLQEGEYKSVKP